jgi:hypothetical protein
LTSIIRRVIISKLDDKLENFINIMNDLSDIREANMFERKDMDASLNVNRDFMELKMCVVF